VLPTWTATRRGSASGANNLCDVVDDEIPMIATLNASITEDITDNMCAMELYPGSYDSNADLWYMFCHQVTSTAGEICCMMDLRSWIGGCIIQP
jgi:hypothetical protein